MSPLLLSHASFVVRNADAFFLTPMHQRAASRVALPCNRLISFAFPNS